LPAQPIPEPRRPRASTLPAGTGERFARLAARALAAPAGLFAGADGEVVADEPAGATPAQAAALLRTVLHTRAPVVLDGLCAVPVRDPGVTTLLGALAAADHGPRAWSHQDVAALEDLAHGLVAEHGARAAHAALTESEARFRGLVETAPAVSYVADYDDIGGLRYISPQIEALTGYAASRFLEDPEFWRAIVHPEDQERIYAQVAEDWRAQRPFNAEYRYIAADGRTVWVWERENIVRDDDGRPVCSRASCSTSPRSSGPRMPSRPPRRTWPPWSRPRR
jgi:PAS domain S-box-containing protein